MRRRKRKRQAAEDGYGKSGIGWYRKHFTLENMEEGEKVYLYFEGVYMDSTVYINGKEAGGHGYGYTSFYVDVTECVREGENVCSCMREKRSCAQLPLVQRFRYIQGRLPGAHQ